MTGAAEPQRGHFCDKFFKNAEEWVFTQQGKDCILKMDTYSSFQTNATGL